MKAACTVNAMKLLLIGSYIQCRFYLYITTPHANKHVSDFILCLSLCVEASTARSW